MKRILVIGANPAWEKVLEFNEFTAGEVNRAVRVDGYAAGKATNFCRALKCLGSIPGRQLTFLGAEGGTNFKQDTDKEGLECLSIPMEKELRTCINCVCNGRMTELVEPGTPITSGQLEQFVELMRDNLSIAAGIAVTGSVPAGSAPEFMRRIAEIARDAGLPLLLDNYRETPDALAVKPDLILKINALELLKLTGQPSIEDGLAWFHEHYPLATAAITDGAKQAWLLSPATSSPQSTAPAPWTLYCVPPIQVLNPLGAGDTCSAVLFARLLEGKQLCEAFAEALAAASASCLTNRAGDFDPQTARQLRLSI